MGERIWDRFLTEQDRAHIARFPAKRKGLGHRPALLMVDVYRNAFGSEPRDLLESVEDAPGSCGRAAWNTLPRLRSLLEAARRSGTPVIHLTGTSEVPRWSDPPTGAADLGSERRRFGYEIMEEVAPLPTESVLAKSAPSGFWGTPLSALLIKMGIDSLIVGGESTSGCVRATVVDARSHGYHVGVVEECVFDRHEAAHAINLFDMDRKYADVITLSEAISYLECEARDATHDV